MLSLLLLLQTFQCCRLFMNFHQKSYLVSNQLPNCHGSLGIALSDRNQGLPHLIATRDCHFYVAEFSRVFIKKSYPVSNQSKARLCRCCCCRLSMNFHSNSLYSLSSLQSLQSLWSLQSLQSPQSLQSLQSLKLQNNLEPQKVNNLQIFVIVIRDCQVCQFPCRLKAETGFSVLLLQNSYQ